MNSAHKMDKSILHIDWCSHQAAKYAVEHWYYRPEMPVGKLVKIGVWEQDRFIGCLLFGRGANHSMLKPYGLMQTEGCELVRVALDQHETSMSRILRIALIFLQKHCPGLRLIVSFADPAHHYGGIYQATNWIYTGMTNGAMAYKYKGERMHGRSVRARWGTSVGIPGLTEVWDAPKHRYILPLDAEMRARVAHLSKPYPKPESASEAS